MNAARRALVVAVFGWWLASCAAPAASGGTQVLALDDEGLRVVVPAGWNAIRSSDVGFGSGRVLFFVANQPLEAGCLQAGDEPPCALPIEALGDGGVLLLWATSGCAGLACELPSDDRRLISGREAAVAPRTGMCDPVGGTEEEVFAVTVTPQRVDWIVICARSPGAEERAALTSILDNIAWRTP